MSRDDDHVVVPFPLAQWPPPLSGSQPPKYLGESAAKWWRHYGPRLERLGLLTVLDESTFGILCEYEADLEALDAELAKGLTYKLPNGEERTSPLFWMRRRLELNWRPFGLASVAVRPCATTKPESFEARWGASYRPRPWNPHPIRDRLSPTKSAPREVQGLR